MATVPNINSADPPPPRPPSTRGKWMWMGVRLLTLAVAGMLFLLIAYRWNAWAGSTIRQTTDDAYLESDVTPLAAHVSGYVRRVLVNDFQYVKRGQLLVELEDADYRAQVIQADANVASSRAEQAVLAKQRTQQLANVMAMRSGVAVAVASADLNKLVADRQRSLLQRGNYTSKQEVDQAESQQRQANAVRSQQGASLLAAQRQVDTLDSQNAVSAAAVQHAQASLELARINLAYTRIMAPSDGMVGLRLVRPGQYVSVGSQLISLVALPKVWVVANYKETQMTRIRLGQPASIHVDAYPGIVLKGHVDSWSPASGSRFALLPPDNASGNFTKVVQRFAVKIVLDEEHLDEISRANLRPGMSVIATIDTQG